MADETKTGSPMRTASADNYLMAIYRLQQASDDPVRTSAIAEQLGLSAPSVTAMLKTLSAEGFLDYVPYQGVRLTEPGRLAALENIRKHRLIELFLMETLDLPWDEIHEEAAAIEHAVSDRLIERIDAFLGRPESDPHGDPIPRADGTIRQIEDVPLSTLAPGQTSTISRVLEQKPEILRYLGDNGLTPGASTQILREEPFDGPLTVEVAGSAIAISRSLAHRILVHPAKR